MRLYLWPSFLHTSCPTNIIEDDYSLLVKKRQRFVKVTQYRFLVVVAIIEKKSIGADCFNTFFKLVWNGLQFANKHKENNCPVFGFAITAYIRNRCIWNNPMLHFVDWAIRIRFTRTKVNHIDRRSRLKQNWASLFDRIDYFKFLRRKSIGYWIRNCGCDGSDTWWFVGFKFGKYFVRFPRAASLSYVAKVFFS